MSEHPPGGSPEWLRELSDVMSRAGRAISEALEMAEPAARRAAAELARMRQTMAAQGAMGSAYRGDLDELRTALEMLPAEQLQEISAAAALLASTADEVLRER
ncbi:hypothetical protein GCM10023194_38730 [Planotetraspora phitsanulokensis]|uniref:Uncharacterized protein n=1 Tax=Planotetraspora phitsanulokensis TaxID=575192 RepID=A0A8J3XKW8_9ACTN|nr:hypothetical protein [Planotetraspora phitsanulokensis]GII43551.1 hypothetical protein Pph01_85540 [Planotetraspora phitsanulokensis]